MPGNLAEQLDTIFNMVMRAIEKKDDKNAIELKVSIEGLDLENKSTDSKE